MIILKFQLRLNFIIGGRFEISAFKRLNSLGRLTYKPELASVVQQLTLRLQQLIIVVTTVNIVVILFFIIRAALV